MEITMPEFDPNAFQGNNQDFQPNPLQKYFRQPKVYITLPSKGEFYPEGTLELPDNGELPVFPMTAKDEITIKTPDALLNGQATVDVIKSCIPSIIDPWHMPSIDLDAVLVGIRVATYGEELTLTTKIPGAGIEKDYTVDLRQLLNKLLSNKFDSESMINGLGVTIRPLTYEEFTESSLKTFEEQRIFNLVNDDTVPDSEKMSKFNESFSKLTALTIDMLCKSVVSIRVEDQNVTNRGHIDEFIKNSDKTFYTGVKEHLETQRSQFELEPMTVNTTEDEQKAGAPKTFQIPITFDQSNFFE
jgi:hypothetical protein